LKEELSGGNWYRNRSTSFFGALFTELQDIRRRWSSSVQPICGLSLLKTLRRAGFKALLASSRLLMAFSFQSISGAFR